MMCTCIHNYTRDFIACRGKPRFRPRRIGRVEMEKRVARWLLSFRVCYDFSLYQGVRACVCSHVAHVARKRLIPSLHAARLYVVVAGISGRGGFRVQTFRDKFRVFTRHGHGVCLLLLFVMYVWVHDDGSAYIMTVWHARSEVARKKKIYIHERIKKTGTTKPSVGSDGTSINHVITKTGQRPLYSGIASHDRTEVACDRRSFTVARCTRAPRYAPAFYAPSWW